MVVHMYERKNEEKQGNRQHCMFWCEHRTNVS